LVETLGRPEEDAAVPREKILLEAVVSAVLVVSWAREGSEAAVVLGAAAMDSAGAEVAWATVQRARGGAQT